MIFLINTKNLFEIVEKNSKDNGTDIYEEINKLL